MCWRPSEEYVGVVAFGVTAAYRAATRPQAADRDLPHDCLYVHAGVSACIAIDEKTIEQCQKPKGADRMGPSSNAVPDVLDTVARGCRTDHHRLVEVETPDFFGRHVSERVV